MKYIYFFLCLLLGMSVQAQIKIGDNPQNIDPSSVLELESSSRVLVITRVNSAQMNAIVPSAGALVYNTDIQCIHYYTGTEWKDICDAVAGSITFTSEDGTVVITPNGGNNYDVKVGQITGMNIVNETVFGADIATATIGERQLAPNSVGSSELQDNTVGKTEIQEAAVGTLEIIDGTIEPIDMLPGAFDQLLTTDAAGTVVWINKNELGATEADQTTITGAGTAADPIKVADTVIGEILANTNSITVNTNNIAQNSNDIADINTALGTKEDLINKSDNIALGNSTTLYPTQNAVKTYVDQLAGAASTLNDGNIFVGSAGNVATGVTMGGDATIISSGVLTISDDAITNSKIADGAVATPQLEDNAVTSNKIAAGGVQASDIADSNVTNAKLDKINIPLSGFGAAAANVNLGNNRIINLDDPQDPQDAATRAFVLAQVGGVGGTGDITSTDLTITGGTNAAFNDVNLEITAGAVGTAELADDSVSSSKILTGAVQTDDIANNSVSPIKIESPGAPNQMLTTDGANAVTWIPIAAGSTELADQVTIVGDGTSGNEFEVANNSITPAKIETPGVPNQMLTTDGANAVTWIPIAAGSTELADGITILGDGSSGNEFEVADGAINSNKITDGTIQAIDISPDAITTSAILDANVTPTKIEPGTNGQFLSTSGGAVIWDNLPGGVGGTVVADGVTIEGNGVSPNPLQVIDGGITTTQIFDGTILAEDLSAMGATTNGQVMKWNTTTTAWEPATDEIGTAVTDTDANDGLTDFNATTGYNVNVDGTTIELNADAIQISDDGVTSAKIAPNTIVADDIATGAVTSDEIADATIAAVDLSAMGATTNGQVMKWNTTTTAWEPATDEIGTEVTDTDVNDGLTDFNATTGYNVNVDGTTIELNADAIQISDDGVTSAKIAPNTIVADDIATGAVTSDEIADATIAAVDLSAMGATTNGQVMKWNTTTTAWEPATDEIGTAVTDTDANDGLSTFSATTGYNINVDNTTVELNGDALRIRDAGVTSAKILNGTIAAEDLGSMGATTNGQVMKWNTTINAWEPATDEIGTAVTDADANDGLSTFNTTTGYNINVDNTSVELNADVLRIRDAGVTSAKILNGTIAAEDLGTMGATINGQVMKWNTATTAWEPATDEIGSAVTDADVNDGLSNFSATTGYNINVDGTSIELNADAIQIADDGVTSAKIAPNTIVADDIATGAVTSDKIANGTIAAIDLSAMGATINGQVMKWNTATTAWEPAADATGSAVTDADVNDGLSSFSATTGYNVNVDGTTIELNADAIQIADDGVTSAKIAPNTIVADDIATGAVTSDEIANGTIAAIDLSAMGATINGQVMKWNTATTAWEPAADATGSAVTDADVNDGLSSFSATTGYNVNVDGTTIELNADAIQIADDGVNSAKIAPNTIVADDIATGAVTSDEIANGTIAAIDLSAMGATINGQVMKWNTATTAWEPATDATGSAVTDADANDGLSTFSATTGYNINVDNTTVELSGDALQISDDGVTSAKIAPNTIVADDIATGAVTSDEIANGTIAAEDLGAMGATINGQVMKWNTTTTAWEPASSSIPTGTSGAIFFSDGAGSLNDSPTTLFWDDTNNRLGIGTDSPDRALHVMGETRSTSFAVSSGTAALPGYSFYTNDDFNTGMFRSGPDELGFSTGGIEALLIDDIQNVGIGIAPTERLHVNGNILAIGTITGTDIAATGNITGIDITATGQIYSDNPIAPIPDYVFQKYFLGNSDLKEGYDFKTLVEIEAFIKEHHHLPGIVSAQEAKEAGKWNLSESNLQNLEKIEELFLHTIEQEKKIDQLKTENESLSAELQLLRKDMEEIKALLKNKN